MIHHTSYMVHTVIIITRAWNSSQLLCIFLWNVPQESCTFMKHLEAHASQTVVVYPAFLLSGSTGGGDIHYAPLTVDRILVFVAMPLLNFNVQAEIFHGRTARNLELLFFSCCPFDVCYCLLQGRKGSPFLYLIYILDIRY